MIIDSPRLFIRPFDDLEGAVYTAFPKDYDNFRLQYGDLLYKIRYLQNIFWRFEKEQAVFKESINRTKELEIQKEHLSPKEFFDAQVKVGKSLTISTELMNLDGDSFFIFARILLDRIPYLLKPFYKGIITTNEPKTIDFKTHIEWFDKHPECILDTVYYDKLVSVREWFYNELREPRNEVIVHPKEKHFVQGIRNNGTITRFHYVLRKKDDQDILVPAETRELPAIASLLYKIIEFMEFLNKHFTEKLKIDNTQIN